jgi:hypothetical protein
LPGLIRTNQVSRPDTPMRLNIAASAGYGHTEALEGEDGAHHRAAGSVAVAFTPISWLSAALRLDGRLDVHPDDAFGEDRTFVGSPSVALRVGGEPSALFDGGFSEAIRGLGIGGELEVTAPGSAAPSVVWDAVSFAATGLLSYRFAEPRVTLATEVGYRRDRTDRVIADPLSIRQGDRIALGVSQFDAILIRLGASYTAGPMEVFGEMSWDVLVGAAAPSATTSPLRFGLGGRLTIVDGFAVSLTSEFLASGRPMVSPFDPLVPVEPRFTILAGIRTRVSFGPEPWDAAAVEEEQEDEEVEETEETTAPGERVFRGRIVDEEGNPVADALVRAERDGAVVEAQTDGDGRYVLTDVPEPPVILTVVASGFDERRIEVPDDGGPPPSLTVQAQSEHGWLRGVVRGFDGEPVQATITVDGREIRTGEDGTFELTLDAGEYEVAIEADGYFSQRRQVVLEADGVVVVNADLRRRRRR